MTEDRQELEAKIEGLQVILAMVLNMLPEDEVRERLQLLESTARKQNLRSETIEVLRSFRETWDPAPRS